MKPKHYIAALLLCASCEADLSDRLDGRWQMQTIESDGTVEHIDTIYYNFQTSLFMYQIYSPANDSYSHCYGFKTIEPDNRILVELTAYPAASAQFIHRTDWESTTRRFVVEQLSASRLVLESDGKRYVFRRF
jgi:hypothetical protein